MPAIDLFNNPYPGWETSLNSELSVYKNEASGVEIGGRKRKVGGAGQDQD